MNAFKIFATMSLVDAISKPLAIIQRSLNSTEGAAGGLSNRLGRLATSFGKVAAASAVFLGALAALTSQAIAFESKMADVAKVVDFESPAELEGMSRAIQDLSLQIPIAADGFADIVAAAAQSGVAKDDLIDFSVQAAKMGVAFDVAAGEASKTMADWRAGMGLTLQETYSLADSVNHLANNMNATAPEISQVLNRVGAVGKAAGFTEQQLAALAATGLSAGASADIVGTGLNSIFATLSQGESMTKEAAKAFQSLGIDVAALGKNMQVDAQGTIMGVMEAIAALPKENQLSVITSAFGQLSLKSIAPMVGNLDNLRQAFGLVGDAANYAGSMQGEYEARSATTENSLQLMKNSFNVLAITIGTHFLPVVDAAAKAISGFIRILISAARTETGAFLLKLAAGIAATVVGVTGLIAAFAILKPILIMVAAALGPIIWPLAAIAGAVTLLAVAWKKDFMGMATMARDFVGKVRLVFRGVQEIFSTLKDGKGELSAELAQEIEAAGLMGLVTTVSKIFYRLQNFFGGLGSGISSGFDKVLAILKPSIDVLIEAINPFLDLFSELGQAAGGSQVSAWAKFGQTISGLVIKPIQIFSALLGVVIRFFAGILRGVKAASDGLGGRLAPAINRIKTALLPVINFIGDLINKFLGLGNSAGTAAGQVNIDIWVRLGEVVGYLLVGAFELAVNAVAWAVTSLTGFGTAAGDVLFGVASAIDWLVNALGSFGAAVGDALFGVVDTISNFSLIDAGMGLIGGFADGIRAGASNLINTVSGVLSQIRAYLPFSDAQVGPLSNLTSSGMAFIETFAAGIKARASALVETVSGMLSSIRAYLPFSDARTGPLSMLTASGMALPGTLAQGVTAGSPSLVAATDNMMNRLNLTPPYFEMPEMQYKYGRPPEMPNLAAPQFEMPELKIKTGFQSDLSLPQFEMPKLAPPKFDMPDFKIGTNFQPALSLPQFEMPKLVPPQFDLPEFNLGANFQPNLPLPQFEMPKLVPPKFDLPNLNSFIDTPQSIIPSYFESTGLSYGVGRLGGGSLPEPSFQVQDGGQSTSPFRSKSDQNQGGRTINFHIGKIELPSVEDADGFVAALQDIVDQRI